MKLQPLPPSRLMISRRARALEAIRRAYRDYGVSPSFAELAMAIDVPVQRVGAIVRDLAARGEISWTPGRARSIQLPGITENLATSALLLALVERGFIVNPQADAIGTLSGIVLPAINGSVTKQELAVPAALGDIPDAVASTGGIDGAGGTET